MIDVSVGAVGTVSGVADTVLEYEDAPTALTALIRTEYDTKLVNPVITMGEDVVLAEMSAPPFNEYK